MTQTIKINFSAALCLVKSIRFEIFHLISVTISTHYCNSSTNYLMNEMSMRQGYAFGTRIRISEEIIKTLKFRLTTCLVTISFESYFG